MPGERVIVHVEFTDRSLLGMSGWRKAAVEIDNAAGQDAPALIADAARLFGVPTSQVRVERAPAGPAHA